MTALALFNAFITRALFCLHVIVSVALVVLHTKQPLYWCFLTGLVFMILEMLYIMVKRRGREYKLFWPSCFLYLSAIVPVIWVMELDLLQHRLDERDQLAKLNKTKIILSQLSVGGYQLSASIDADVAAKKVCELGVLLFIILGRWLLPRGKLTREQLSNLLLVYIGMGADILDLFEPLTHPNVKHSVRLLYTTLVLFTWSMLQFCLIAMATAGSDDNSEGSIQREMEMKTQDVANVESGKARKQHQKSTAWTESASSSTSDDDDISDDESVANSITTQGSCEVRHHTENDVHEAKTRRCKFFMSADLVSILSSLVMHDGPFLIFRLVLVAMYQVTSEIHLFFTAKNALTVAIMLYRLYILVHDSRAVAPGEDTQNHRRGSKATTN